MDNAANTAKLAQKLVDIMKAVGRVPKNGWNEFHKYHYALEADVLEALRGEMAAKGVLLLPAITGRSRESVGEKGQVVTHLDMEFTFIDAETGEMITRPWLGAGADKEDKGAYKCMTGGEKTFLLKTFLIPTGDDPEQDATDQTPSRRTATPPRPATTGATPSKPAAATSPAPPPRPPTVSNVTIGKISDAQRKRFFAISKEHGWTEQEVKALLKRVLNVDSSADIPTHRYKEIVKMLEAGVD